VPTTTFFFVRHIPHVLQGRVHVGRMDGIELAEGAPERLARVGRRLARERLDAVYASPISRTQRTAAAVAEPHGLPVQTRDGLIEIDAGDWTGRPFDAFAEAPARKHWDAARSFNRVPGGETMLEVQCRMVAVLEELRDLHPEGRVAVVSHGDPLKAVILYLLGMPLDAHDRIETDPGSVTTAVVGEWGAKVLRLNEPVLDE